MSEQSPRRLAGPLRSTALVLAALLALPVGVAAVAVPPASAAQCPAPGGATVPEATARGDVVFRGHGWGHGLGMSQYGAQGAARLGCTYTDILTTYYTGTTVAPATMPGRVFVRMLSDGYRVDVVAETADVPWVLTGCAAACPPVQPKGATWQLRLDATATKYALWDLGATPKKLVWQGGTPTQTLRLRHNGSVVHETTWRGNSIFLDRRLRWGYTRFAITGGLIDGQQVIEDDAEGTAMDKYLWGIAEVPVSWTNGAHEALKAQAVAARTYAAKRPGQALMPTPADQNYTGYAKEAQDGAFKDAAGQALRWKAAVDETSGQVVTATGTGALIDTYYSSSHGGRSEDERYVWGQEAPFLRSIDDSAWEMASSNLPAKRSWAAPYTWSALATALGYERLSSISVPARGTDARTHGVRITGFQNGALVTRQVEGWDVRQALGLPSPGFTISVRRIGGATAVPVVGDWDGDGDDDPGWWRAGEAALLVDGRWTKRLRLGKPGDVPVVGDWNRDGADDIGIFRSGRWFVRKGKGDGPLDTSFTFGTKGDRPVVGRWNGKTLGIGVVRSGRWLLRATATGGRTQASFRYGAATDRPVVGDWDGNGTTTVGVVRGGRWLLRDRLKAGAVTRSFRYGLPTDLALPGDWNGDRRMTAGVSRGQTFYLRNRVGGGPVSRTVGFAG
jgi:SpoIID/LytB domain protein